MTSDLSSELRRLIRESGKNVKKVSEESGVGYLKLVRWYSGRTVILDVRMAERLYQHFTGRRLV